MSAMHSLVLARLSQIMSRSPPSETTTPTLPVPSSSSRARYARTPSAARSARSASARKSFPTRPMNAAGAP